ncbi:ATP-binding protein [Novosphingobium guangzhouense]|uniref:AAA family ATPase n=1 Tax=Novosphingobium guangzhouense TaxID=1850347 RepID=A0A2K2G4V3_9SPHN|nr:type IV secretory system conjugative DNA transfer family protein [Novosphingobium guangzhouense]PNU06073.1 AAA family ATPase [Novosphingobium guangzhouense]
MTIATHDFTRDAKVPLGHCSTGTLELDLGKLMSGRCLIQGSSGAGKSQTLRRIIEEAFDYLTTIIVDPEGEFANLAAHIGATTVIARDYANDGLTALALRTRQHRIALHLDLTDLEPDHRIEKAAAFFAGLLSAPREHWAHTVLVCIDEAHLLAPHMAASARDAETRRLGVATLTDMCARGRKRGIGTIIATQRLAKLASSVVSELHNHLIGLNVFDRDVARAADLLGFGGDQAAVLRQLPPGEFFAFGPALSALPVLAKIDTTITPHIGRTPDLVAAADLDPDESRTLLDLDTLREVAPARSTHAAMRGQRALDAFLLDPAAPAAARIVGALGSIAPNATTADDLARHLALPATDVDAGLDLLAAIGASDTMPRGDTRIARLSARLRLRVVDTPVVGLA